MVDGVVSIPLSGRELGGSGDPAEACGVAVPLSEFIVGPENRLVAVAVRTILEETSPNGLASAYNPLVFYGSSGTGKSHLAWGLARACKELLPRRRVEYTTAVDFARDLTDAIEAQGINEFRKRYRQAWLLVVEDITHLADKEYAQRELLYTLDAIFEAGHRVVVTASSPPGQWPRIVAGLQSRLSAGLTVPLVSPGRNTRLVILERLAKERRVRLTSSAAEILADGLNTTVPGLTGALIELHLHSETDARAIDAEAAGGYLRKRRGVRQPKLAQIAAATARSFSLRVTQLRSNSRTRTVVTARGMAMYLARQLTENTLQQIGNYFGGRDHTTVMHGCRKTEQLLKSEPTMQQTIQRVQDWL